MSRAEPTNGGEQTVRVLDEAYKTIRSGAPGLSDQTCNVLAGIIARKVSIIYAQPQPSQDDALISTGRPDDYEGPDVGMHDTEIVESEND